MLGKVIMFILGGLTTFAMMGYGLFMFFITRDLKSLVMIFGGFVLIYFLNKWSNKIKEEGYY